MAKKPEDPVIVGLTGKMPGVLESLKQQGDGAYPPNLRRLAELCGVTASDEQIRKAASKREFTSRANPLAKLADKKLDLDAPVYLKGDDGTDNLASKMLLVLESQRPLGRGAYPPSLRKLAELSGVNGSDARVPKAAVLGPMAERAIVAAKSGVKPVLDAPIFLGEDLDASPSDLLPALLQFALTPVPPKGKAVETHAFSTDDLAKRLIEPLRKPFTDALDAAVKRGGLPPGVAWVTVKGKPLLFLLENLRPGIPDAPRRAESHPAAPSPASDFASAFRGAFDRVDRRNGATNFVKLSDLRRELTEFDRDAFDAGLRRLRLAGEFSLDSHEGLHGFLSSDDRDAGVREGGSLLIYVSRG